jgi:hypothetical protein
MRVLAMTIPISSTALRVLTIGLAPVQWGAVLWYVNSYGRYPNSTIRRLVPWIVMLVACVVVPIAIYLINARMTSPDHVTKIVGAIEEVLFVALLLFGLKRITNSKK